MAFEWSSRVRALVVVVVATTSGCVVSPRGVHTVGQLAAAVIWTAAIAGQIAILASHDAHLHHEQCGHYRRWHDSRWVYYYGGHWEYYEPVDARWYYYVE